MLKRRKHIRQRHNLSILPRRVGRPRKFKAWNSVIALTVLILIILVPSTFMKVNILKDQVEAKDALISPLIAQNKQLTEKDLYNSQLLALQKKKIEDLSTITVDSRTRDIVLYYINKYFGNQADKAIKVFTCESGLNPGANHTNAPGLGTDSGISQLNSVYQSKRFEKMFPGIGFSTGAHDIDMNLKVAKAIFDEQGFQPWVCAKILHIS